MAAARSSAFGTQLRRHREAAGWSQEDLAERAGLAAKAIGALERGERRRPYPRTVQVLADALGLDEARRRELISAVPRSTTPRFSDGAPFVGRYAELAALLAKLEAAVSGGSGFAMIVGEAGIGKTRLAHEFAHAAQAQGVTVLSGRCVEGDWRPPFGPWAEAIDGYARARQPDELRNDLGSGAPYLAQFVPAVRAALPGLTTPGALNPNDERLRLYEAVTSFVRAISGAHPVLVFLDDLHWADPDSLRLLRHLARTLNGAQALVLGAYRDPELGVIAGHPLMTTLAALRRETACETIRLRGLSREEVSAYLAHAAGRALPRTLVELIERETSGNPFYARELFRHLAEHRRTLSSGADDPALRVEDLGIPEGVRQVVDERIHRLSPATARALQDAAGFGEGFTFPELQRLTGLAEGELLDCIDEAVEAGLIHAGVQDDSRYEFAHAIVRHTLYERQSRDRRVRLHRRIAIALEQAYSGRELERAAELAVHYYASAELEGAFAGVPYALAAAEQARSTFAHERAADLLRMALELTAATMLDKRAEILCRLAIARAEAVQLDEARRSADDALDAMKTAGSAPRALAEFLAVFARLMKDAGASPQIWAPFVNRGLALIDGQRDLLWARLTLLRDQYEWVQSGPVAAGSFVARDPEAVSIARTDGDEADYAQTLEPLEWRTRHETDSVLATVRTWSRPVAVLRGLDVVGRDLQYRHGEFAEAGAMYEELLVAGRRYGSIPAQAEALAQIAVSQVATGKVALAQETARRADELIRKLGPSHRLHLVGIGLKVGFAYFLGGDWRHLARELARYADDAGAARAPMRAIVWAYRALCASHTGTAGDARVWLEHIGRVVGGMPATAYGSNQVLGTTTTVVWELEDVEGAAVYHELLERLQQAGVGDAIAFGPFELSKARMAALMGSVSEAQEQFDRARRKMAATGSEPHRAIIDLDEARALIRWQTADEARIASLLDTSADSFRRHRMFGWARRAVEFRKTLALRKHN
jgi:transcriptional regulator with XRE-family HTH domain